jgi:hypothetical protein
VAPIAVRPGPRGLAPTHRGREGGKWAGEVMRPRRRRLARQRRKHWQTFTIRGYVFTWQGSRDALKRHIGRGLPLVGSVEDSGELANHFHKRSKLVDRLMGGEKL